MKKENSRKSGKAMLKLKQHREEASERNATWAALTPKQKLAALDKRGVTAKKQRAKLEKLA